MAYQIQDPKGCLNSVMRIWMRTNRTEFSKNKSLQSAASGFKRVYNEAGDRDSAGDDRPSRSPKKVKRPVKQINQLIRITPHVLAASAQNGELTDGAARNAGKRKALTARSTSHQEASAVSPSKVVPAPDSEGHAIIVRTIDISSDSDTGVHLDSGDLDIKAIGLNLLLSPWTVFGASADDRSTGLFWQRGKYVGFKNEGKELTAALTDWRDRSLEKDVLEMSYMHEIEIESDEEE